MFSSFEMARRFGERIWGSLCRQSGLFVRQEDEEIRSTLSSRNISEIVNRMGVNMNNRLEIDQQVEPRSQLPGGSHPPQLSRFFADEVATRQNFRDREGQTGSELDTTSHVEIKRDGLLESFECKICLGFLSVPVRMCENGHLVCSLCYDQLEVCGMCRGAFLETILFGVDAMLENFKLPCFYKEEGCTLIINASERRQHGLKCIYRPILCDAHSEPMECHNRPIDFRMYERHMRETHNISHLDGEENSRVEIIFTDEDITRYGGLYPLQAVSCLGRTFIVRNLLENQMFFTWCTILGGTEIDAVNYRVNVHLTAALDETLEESKVRNGLPIYSSHFQHLGCFSEAGPTPFQISLASLRQTAFSEGNARYGWIITYEFYRRD